MQTILVVDDDTTICQTLSMILRGRGYHVVGAASHGEAERHFERNAVDLVIFDHGLAGVTGSALARRFKGMKKVWVLMLTGDRKLLGTTAAVDVLLPKPPHVPSLLAEIEGLFARAA